VYARTNQKREHPYIVSLRADRILAKHPPNYPGRSSQNRKRHPEGECIGNARTNIQTPFEDHGIVYPIPGHQTNYLQLDQSRQTEAGKSKVEGLFPVPGRSKTYEYGMPGHEYLNLSFSPAPIETAFITFKT